MHEFKDGETCDIGGESEVFGPVDILEDIWFPKDEHDEKETLKRQYEEAMSIV